MSRLLVIKNILGPLTYVTKYFVSATRSRNCLFGNSLQLQNLPNCLLTLHTYIVCVGIEIISVHIVLTLFIAAFDI